jgi:hypothetical protein
LTEVLNEASQIVIHGLTVLLVGALKPPCFHLDARPSLVRYRTVAGIATDGGRRPSTADFAAVAAGGGDSVFSCPRGAAATVEPPRPKHRTLLCKSSEALAGTRRPGPPEGVQGRAYSNSSLGRNLPRFRVGVALPFTVQAARGSVTEAPTGGLQPRARVIVRRTPLAVMKFASRHSAARLEVSSS